MSPMEDSIDMVVPFWYIAKYTPSGLYVQNLKFDGEKCQHKCTQHSSEEFTIEWNKSILDSPTSQIGILGSISFSEEGEIEINWKKLVPKRY